MRILIELLKIKFMRSIEFIRKLHKINMREKLAEVEKQKKRENVIKTGFQKLICLFSIFREKRQRYFTRPYVKKPVERL